MNYNVIKKSYIRFINDNNPLGYEIKAQRLKRDLTLSVVSYHLIHTSYLSKAENNQAKLRKEVINDVCKRIEITENQIMYIENSKSKIIEAFIYYLEDDIDRLKKLAEEGEGLLNYIYKTIKVIYSLSVGDIFCAKELIDELNSCIKSIPVFELKYICATGVLFDFVTGRFADTINGLNTLDEMDLNFILITFNKYIRCKILFIKNDSSFYDLLNYFKYNDSIREISGLYEKVMYYYELSCLKNNKDYIVNKFKFQFYPNYYRNLCIFKEFLNGKVKTLPTDKTPLFFKCLYEYNKGLDYSNTLNEMNSFILDVDSSKLLLDYLNEDFELKLDFIFDKAVPVIKSTGSAFLKRYFTREVAQLSERTKRYKLIFKIYALLD